MHVALQMNQEYWAQPISQTLPPALSLLVQYTILTSLTSRSNNTFIFPQHPFADPKGTKFCNAKCIGRLEDSSRLAMILLFMLKVLIASTAHSGTNESSFQSPRPTPQTPFQVLLRLRCRLSSLCGSIPSSESFEAISDNFLSRIGVDSPR
jgi:hypothetical protein